MSTITTIDKAINRFTWRFQNLKDGKFAPNQTDVEALQFIAEWVNSQQEETIREQQIFAKFFVRELSRNLWESGDLKFALYATKGVLDLPLEAYVKIFHTQFNVLKYRMYCEENNIEWQIPKNITQADLMDVYNHLKSDKKYMKHLLGYWKKEQIETSIINELTDVIAKYKNLQ